MKDWISRYIAYATPQTAASEKYHRYMGYSILSQVIGRKATCYMFGGHKGPNLWFVVLGPSSMGFKSTILRIGVDILQEAYEGLPFKYPNGGSYESFIELVDEQHSGIILADEFVNLLGWMDKDYARAIMGLITEMYDQGNNIYRRVGTRKNKQEYTLHNPYINIFAASTIEWFNKRLKEEMISGGFLPRFIIINSSNDNPRVLAITPKADDLARRDLIMDLHSLKALEPCEFKYDADGEKMFTEWYENRLHPMTLKASERLNPFLHRRASDVHKFAMIHAVLRGSTGEINTEDTDLAITLIEQAIEDTQYVINEKLILNDHEKDRDKVLTLIKKHQKSDTRGAKHSLILRYSHIEAFKFKRIVETLQQEETIKTVSSDVLGQPTVFYSTNGIHEGE